MDNAKKVYENLQQSTFNHFVDINKMIQLAKGVQCEINKKHFAEVSEMG